MTKFENVRKYIKIFHNYGFNFGRCLGSKTLYHETHPNNLIIFNARIYLKSVYEKRLEEVQDFFKGQSYEIWFGDLNLNEDIYKLFKLMIDIKEPIVITTEHGSKVIEI